MASLVTSVTVFTCNNSTWFYMAKHKLVCFVQDVSVYVCELIPAIQKDRFCNVWPNYFLVWVLWHKFPVPSFHILQMAYVKLINKTIWSSVYTLLDMNAIC